MATRGRITLGPLDNPVRGLLHGSAALASLAVAGELWQRSAWGDTRLALLAFALSQAALFAVSALYHSVPWGERAKGRMQRLDHSMIYLTRSEERRVGKEGRGGGRVETVDETMD